MSEMDGNQKSRRSIVNSHLRRLSGESDCPLYSDPPWYAEVRPLLREMFCLLRHKREAVDREDFEAAAEHRDQIARLRSEILKHAPHDCGLQFLERLASEWNKGEK